MGAGVYLQAAAGQVRNAIGSLEDDIRTIEHDSYDFEVKLEHEASREETEAQLLRITEYAVKGSGEKRALEAHEAKLVIDARQKEQVAKKRKAEAARAIQVTSSLLSSLRSTAIQLDKFAGSAQ